MSIGESYTPESDIPNYDVFEDIDVKYKSICIVSKDQNPFSGFSSPTCFYEFDMEFCRADSSLRGGIECRQGGFTGHGSGPDSIQITGGRDGFFGAFGQVRSTIRTIKTLSIQL